ncbi:phosphate acyltransferase PlsX [Hominenteromicrobium sp.]|uniref:phosphate acyltransferase PlsX n=2 Tax=Oscillospiraceae TaxID=216572 RepID=UPI003A8EB8D0
MRIIIDAFGGDNAPDEIIKGCRLAADELHVQIVLTGDEKKIRAAAEKLNVNVSDFEIIDCPDVITMEDEPTAITRAKKQSSMAVGLRALAEGKGDAFASAGNSGALVVGATLLVKRIKGVKRVAFAPLMPKSEGFFMLADGGANNECRPEMLEQFGMMGSVYMQKVMGVQKPRIGLANVGTEPHKGGELQHAAFALLSENKDVHFIGNIEARDIPFDAADVVVCDGFTGNILLKMYEGVAMALMNKFKAVFKKSLKNKLAAAMVLNDMKAMKKELDYNEYGGAPILGCSKPVFKVHGSAKASTLKNAIALTVKNAESGIISEITAAQQNEKTENTNEKQDSKGITMRSLDEFEKKIGYKFKNRNLLITALTHSSYANESRGGDQSYERLEFLGDSILGFVTAEYLCKAFPDIPEGKLTKKRAALVCEKSLCGFTRSFGAGELLRLSHGEQHSGGRERPSILADVFESITAAIYLDSGSLEEAKRFVLHYIEPAAQSAGERPFKDHKTMLQEIIQQNPGERLEYVLTGEHGPDHDKHFTVEVHLNSNVIGKGGGRSKKEAEQQAAREALELMGY